MKTAGFSRASSFTQTITSLGLVAFAAVPQLSWAQSGPQMPRSQAPFKSQMLSPVPRPTHFEQGDWQSAFSVTPASIYASDYDAQGELIELDYYTIEYRFEFNYTPHQDWQLGASLGYRTSDDAALDQATLSFHKAFNFDQNGRDVVGKDRYLVHFPSAGYQFTDFGNHLLARQYELSASYRLLKQQQHQASSTFSAQYHDDALLKREGDPWDLAGQLDYAYQVKQHQFTLMAAYSYTGAERLFSVPVDSTYWHGALGYRYWFTPRHRLALDYLSSEGVSTELGGVGQGVYEVNLAYRYQYDVWGWDFVIMQNTINADSSADIAFHFRVSHRLHVD